MVLTWFLDTLILWAASLAVASPLIIWAVRRQPASWRQWAGLAIFFFASLALFRSESVLRWLPSPWQGMTLEGLLALAVILATRSARTSGLGFKIERAAWRDAGLVTAAFLLFVVARNAALRWAGLSGPDAPLGLEYLVYQATLPGLAEELTYRGVIQSHLGQTMPRPWKLFNARLGLGFAITALLFWAVHAVRVDDLAISFHWQTISMQLPAALLFGWLRERTGSIWPVVFAHNLVNLVWQLV